MKIFIVFAALLVSVTCQDATLINSAGCGRRISERDSINKIVGGVTADPEDWGWQVAMNISGIFACGGSLINSQWILSAAHCVFSNVASDFSFDIGIHDRAILEPWSVRRRATKVFIHPFYTTVTWRNDIALFKLESPVTYSKQIVPVCIPDGSVNYAGRDSYATGWGLLSIGGSVSRYLQEVKVPFLTDTRCKQKLGTAVDTTIMVCAGETGEGKDSCHHDSGGPLVVKHIPSDGEKADDVNNNAQPANRWYVAGITSFGVGGCGNGGVYARTSQYYNWIKSTIRSN